ncbi:MAG: YbaB/EbfC family nucleoid-associated protein [Candidatus Komeilibacteria bacterium]
MSLFSKINDLKDLKNQAQAMQTILEQEIVEIDNDLIYLEINGKQDILELTLKEEFTNDKEATEQAIKNAFTEGVQKVQRVMASKMNGMIQ